MMANEQEFAMSPQDESARDTPHQSANETPLHAPQPVSETPIGHTADFVSMRSKPKDLKQRYPDLAAGGTPPSSDQHSFRTASGASALSSYEQSTPRMMTPTSALGSSTGSPPRAKRSVPAAIQTQRTGPTDKRVSRIVSSSSANSPTTSTHSSSGSIMDRPRPKPKPEMSTTVLMKHPRIVVTLLPYLNINSFLNLIGSDNEIRKYMTGEQVGRWVMREWGVTIDRERGRSWPGLTVWEGFREY